MQRNTDILLDVQNLTIKYVTDAEVVHAVNGISFTLNRGETMGVVGETGAGKTTTAMGILRLLQERTARITSGKILFRGTDILTMSEPEMQKLRGEKISMIFQDPMTALNPVLTIGDQIAEALELHNYTKSDVRKKRMRHNRGTVEKRVEEVLEQVGIPASRKNEYPYQFSGGMKQRVVIAIALACEPELLIADEPTTALDVTIQAQVLDMMTELRKKLGMSMLMITHDLGIVADTCDSVAVMYAGEIIEQGTVEDIFLSEKRHPYTTGLFNSLPDLEVETDRLHPIEGLMPDPTDLPPNCKFAPRCQYCNERCVTTPPPVYVDGTHSIRCHLFGEEEMYE